MQLNVLQSEIEGIYGKAKLCLENSSCLSLEPGKMLFPKERIYLTVEIQLILETWSFALLVYDIIKYEDIFRYVQNNFYIEEFHGTKDNMERMEGCEWKENEEQICRVCRTK